jgi:hypothetical protein
MNFKRELENQIRQQRLEEWTKKRLEESAMKKEDDEVDEELSECEKILDDKPVDTIDNDDCNEEDSDETDIDNDEEIELQETKKPKCDYIDDEAESEDDCSETDLEKSDSEEEIRIEEDSTKRPTRILKPDSDSSDDENTEIFIKPNFETNVDNKPTEKTLETLRTPMKAYSDDLFESQDQRKANESFSFDCMYRF